MKYRIIFEKQKATWQKKLSSDEWYFTNFREKLIRDISVSDLLECIDDLVHFIMIEKDRFLLSEQLETLYCLVKKLDSTEIPACIQENLTILDNLFNKEKYMENIWNDIKNIFLI